MHYLRVYIATTVFISYVCFVIGQTSCVTPNRVPGTCKQLFDCPSLTAVLNKANKSDSDVKFLKKSQCGFQDSIPTVCCPPEKDGLAQDCYTPDGDTGTCVDIYQCKHIIKLLEPPFTKDNITFVQNSRCLGRTQYSVCCSAGPTTRTDSKSCDTTVSAYPPDPAAGCCGLDDRIWSKIVGGGGPGTEIDPWLVLIGYQKDGAEKHLCGGVLISGRYVITAAHCVIGEILKFGTPATVRLGDYDLANDGFDCVAPSYDDELYCNDDVLKIPIESIISHPGYISNSPERRNDIALIRLGSLAPYTDFIHPICLPQTDLTKEPPPNFRFIVAGWGAINITQGSNAFKEHVDLPYVNPSECLSAYKEPGRRINLWNKQLCAGGVQAKDFCKGESGGPLMYQNLKYFEVIGVDSFGLTSCGKSEVPGIYTKVFEYKDWILSHITP